MGEAATIEGNGVLGAGGRGGGLLNKGFVQFDGAAKFLLNEVSLANREGVGSRGIQEEGTGSGGGHPPPHRHRSFVPDQRAVSSLCANVCT